MRRLLEGYPVKLQDMFPTLPNHIKKINAAYQRPDGMIVLFTGNIDLYTHYYSKRIIL